MGRFGYHWTRSFQDTFLLFQKGHRTSTAGVCFWSSVFQPFPESTSDLCEKQVHQNSGGHSKSEAPEGQWVPRGSKSTSQAIPLYLFWVQRAGGARKVSKHKAFWGQHLNMHGR